LAKHQNQAFFTYDQKWPNGGVGGINAIEPSNKVGNQVPMVHQNIPFHAIIGF
jgi:hypothetical protein